MPVVRSRTVFVSIHKKLIIQSHLETATLLENKLCTLSYHIFSLKGLKKLIQKNEGRHLGARSFSDNFNFKMADFMN